MSIGPPEQPDVLGFFFGRKGSRVLPASRVSRRTREREISGYQAAYPGTSRRQAQRATASMRRRGSVPQYGAQPTPEQAAQSQVFRQRSERSRIQAQQRSGYIRYIDDEQVYQVLLDQFEYMYTSRLSRGQAPSDQPFVEWNEQTARWNIAHASVADKERWLNADPWDLLDEVSRANRQGQFSFLFYHNDFYQAA